MYSERTAQRLDSIDQDVARVCDQVRTRKPGFRPQVPRRLLLMPRPPRCRAFAATLPTEAQQVWLF